MFWTIKTCIFNLFRTIKKEKYPKFRAGSDGAFRNCAKLKTRELFIKNPRKSRNYQVFVEKHFEKKLDVKLKMSKNNHNSKPHLLVETKSSRN